MLIEDQLGPEEKGLLQDIINFPYSPSCKRIYADWLDDHNQPALAYTLRWAAKNLKMPRYSAKADRWYWLWEGSRYTQKRHVQRKNFLPLPFRPRPISTNKGIKASFVALKHSIDKFKEMMLDV